MSEPAKPETDSAKTSLINVEVKDLIGLGKPLTKLCEYLPVAWQSMFVPLIQSWCTRRPERVIEEIANAVNRNPGVILQGRYASSGLDLMFTNNKEPIQYEATIEERAFAAARAKEIEKQKNIEAIVATVAANLASEESVPESVPDQDWVNRFFNYAEDVSKEQMRLLWAKVLAGEIKRPTSISIRTLEFLRSLSSDEATLIAEVSNSVIRLNNHQAGILISDSDEGELPLENKLKLIELGLLNPDNHLCVSFELIHDAEFYLQIGSSGVVIKSDKDLPKISLPMNFLTRVGLEVIALSTYSQNYQAIRDLIRKLPTDGLTVVIGTSPDAHNFSGGISLPVELMLENEVDIKKFIDGNPVPKPDETNQ